MAPMANASHRQLQVSAWTLTWGMVGLLWVVLALSACGRGGSKDILSPEERQWLNDNQGRIVVGIETGYAPFVFLDAEGHPTGLAHEHLLLVESKLGTHFQRRHCNTLDEIFTKVQEGEIQVVNAVAQTPWRSGFISFTKPFLAVPNVIIVRKERSGPVRDEQLRGLRVSLVRGYSITEHLTRKNLGLVPDLVADDLDGLLNVSFGRADAVVIDLARASYLIQRKGITNLRVAGEAGLDLPPLSMGTSRTEPQLFNILEKGLASVTEAERQTIRKRWINTSDPSILSDRRLWLAAGILVCIVLVAIVVVLAWNRELRRQVALRTQALAGEKESLRESEAQNRALISAIPDLLFTNRRDGEYLAVQASDTSRLFLPPEAFLHRRPQDLFPKPLADRFMKAFEDALDSGAVKEVHYTLPIEGQEYHFEARVSPCTEDSVITIVRDVTQHKREAQALRTSQDLIAKAFAVSPDAFAINGLEDGVYLEINEGFTSVTGYTEAEVIGRSSVADPTPFWADRKDWQRLVAGLKEKGEVIDLEATFLKKGGRPFIGLMSAKVFEVNGTNNILSITRDITDRKKTEEENAKLQAQLQQAQKMDSLGSLAGGVAHDMNNVLGAILGMASAHIEAQPLGSPAQRAFDTIIKAAERGREMVKGLLGFARQSPAEEHELDVNAILREEVRLLEHTTLSKVHLEIDLATGLWPIRGDASALAHAFMNLCVNAVDAMPETGTLSLRTRNVEGAWTEVLVEDTGTGMPKEVLEKALDPFFTTKEVGKGTGLGLSLVYSTVKAHRGQMEIQSEPGKGTRVRMRFPACKPGLQPPLPAPEQRPATSHGRLKILLVDDDELIQSSTQVLLEVLGHDATAASSGEEALAKLEAGFQPDVVILDMNMPGLGGAATLPHLRALRPTVPVLLTTGRIDQTVLKLVGAHPFVTLLSKPFNMMELQTCLERYGKG